MFASLDLHTAGGRKEEQPKLAKAAERWGSRSGVEVSALSLSRLVTQLEGSESKAANFALRANATVFTPGAPLTTTAATPAEESKVVEVDKEQEEADLPAVISVKKSHRGCAVVLLRSRVVMERGAAMSVAVVDGVCVEVKVHGSKRLAEGEQQQMGLFVAWGHRVERKVSVSEEGLEAYFNALADVPCPGGLEARPPFEEQHLSFPLVSSAPATLDLKPKVEAATKGQLLESAFCSQDLVQAVWDAKGRLDDLWNIPPPPMARSLMTRVARAQLFPHSGEGGKEHENRAGDKLAELSDIVGLMDGVPKGAAFLDLCGGPGAWSQFLLAHRALALRGYGLTLASGSGDAGDWQAENKDDWYPELMSRPDWRAVWGSDGTGDLLKPGNIEHCCARELPKGGVFIVAADGGFSDKAIPANLLELYFYRLFLGELLMAASCLQPGGRFVCKLYSTLSSATCSLLHLTTRLFESVAIVKPMSSRVTGPERYLVAFGFKAGQPETAEIRAALLRSHMLGNGRSPLTTPLLTPIVSADAMERDSTFMDGARAMSSALCKRQAQALSAVVDRAGRLETVALSVADAAEAAPVRFAPTQKAPAAPAPEPVPIYKGLPTPQRNQRGPRRYEGSTKSGYPQQQPQQQRGSWNRRVGGA